MNFKARQIARKRIAKQSHICCSKNVQDQARKNEIQLAKSLKRAWHWGSNEPFDVVIGLNKPRHFIEVKTIIRGKNNKITMHPESLRTKKALIKIYSGVKVHTVVFDDREKQIYYREGIGSFRLTTMIKVKSLNRINKIIQES